MVKSSESCWSLQTQTAREQRWPYDEYYFGDKDEEGRKNGTGENHWTGAESLEWYIGPMLRDTMHGEGDYRWRYKDPDGSFVTYEGRFFANQLHGYGVMSYPDGMTFIGLFYKDVRWGPGIERMTRLRANVGFWRGTQLARLNWRPEGPSVIPNLAAGPTGPAFLEPFRIVLKKTTKIIGETNSAIELLKHYGANPVHATEKWTKLYPKYCTDMESVLCYKDLFDRTYYKGKIHSLEEAKDLDLETEDDNNNNDNKKDGDADEDEAASYFAWNNNVMMLHIMKHCYQHEKQRNRVKLDLKNLINGPRKTFRPASNHERNCRTLLLASFVGDITNVTQLVNEKDVYSDLADASGNTALMYAVSGDQIDVIHFLIEAGANVNAYNDSCCTPLGIALMRHACVTNEIPYSAMVNSLLPPKVDKKEQKPEKFTPARQVDITMEWQITRESVQTQQEVELKKVASIKKFKSASSIIRKPLDIPSKTQEKQYDSDEDIIFSDEKKIFLVVNREYNAKVSNEFNVPSKGSSFGYLFSGRDMTKDIDAALEEIIKLTTEKQPASAKGKGAPAKSKGAAKASVAKLQSSKLLPKEGSSSSFYKEKTETLSKIQLTILQLLADGADPKLVNCPQPAILMATKSGSSELVKHLVAYGADVDQKFPEFLDYTVLDMLISEPFSNDNLDLIRTLLEIGADANHRLKYEDRARALDQEPDVPVPADGPTLLHAIVLKKAEFQFEEDIRYAEMELLLQYNADPTIQYRGRSPIDCAMIKKLTLLDPFINHSGTNLNSIINENNQTILAKLFSREYFKTLLGVDKIPTLTSLLLYGADPLLECYDKGERYENVFEFAQKVLNEIAPPPVHIVQEPKASIPSADIKGKGKKNGKDGKDVKVGKSKSTMKNVLPPEEKKKDKNAGIEAAEYKEAVSMMRECARLLYVRWLQARLLKELINVIVKFKHRHWTMIIKEHNNRHRLGIWVNTPRCLEIWNIFETTNKKKYKEEKILRTLLRIVQLYQKRLKEQKLITPSMTAEEKNVIETDVGLFMREHKFASRLAKEAEAWKRTYVKPELAYKAHKKFRVCFECSLRLQENNIVCDFCGLVSFCNFRCLLTNIERASGHPCSEQLKEKYTTLPESP